MINFWTDTHAHIYLKDFHDDRQEMMDRAQGAGVKKILMPNIDVDSIEAILRVEDQYPQCYAMMGLHPCSVKKGFEKDLQTVESNLFHRKFVGVGEIGTDMYWDKDHWEEQREAFLIQIQWAKTLNLPVAIHCRESLDQTLDLVEKEQDGNLRGVFHCFSGNLDQARRIENLGFYMGIGGVLTFKNGGLDKILPSLSLDRIILETDSPYLAPVPHRGKRNEPSYIPLVGKFLSSLMGFSWEDVQSRTSMNALTLFNIMDDEI